MSLKSRLVGAVALAVLAAPAGAQAVALGPDPTITSVRQNGTFNYDRIYIGDGATPGFGAAEIYAPRDLTEKVGAIAIAPGFTENLAAVRWLGPRLASHGFAVMVFDVTNTFTDLPGARASQLLRAVDYLRNSSPVAARIDATRTGVSGHSMGGGGAIEAASRRPSIKAAVPLTPWHTRVSWNNVQAPTLIIGAQNDIIAPVASHSVPFYNSLPATGPKQYFEYRGADHFITNSANPAVGAQTVSWFKRYVDGDTRYTKFLTPTQPAIAGRASRYWSSGVN
ncbi:MAG: dienelactone hydrolase family protein [Solirubrobacteraceae bacterium]|nr:dienelactone hydrolase family protein [Solirubrobacteraceae bacterium]